MQHHASNAHAKQNHHSKSEVEWWKVVRRGGLYIQSAMSLKSRSCGVLKEEEMLQGVQIGYWIKHSRGYSVREQGKKVYIEKFKPPLSDMPNKRGGQSCGM